jgi:hypothetical protein
VVVGEACRRHAHTAAEGFHASQQYYLTGVKDFRAPETSGTVTGSNSKKGMSGGYAEASATFYRNGLIVIVTHSVSSSYTQGTKGSVFVVGSDSKGNALFAVVVLGSD